MIYDLIGVGIGPFNLSLAALLEKVPNINNIFIDKKTSFTWHPELMFADSVMQTNFLTDLVTPMDPTSYYSFLNYLSANNLFYHFLNTERLVISRMEFEQYCQWAVKQLSHKLKFNNHVTQITFKNEMFSVSTDNVSYLAKNICIATGLTPKIPECAKPFLCENLFYAKSAELLNMKLDNKKVAIIGGGQTGIEIFSNILQGKWGTAKSLHLVTSRSNLEAYDTSPFTNEYFTPAYLDSFWNLHPDQKAKVITQQYLLSDGNTPSYLYKLYNDLYQKKYVEHDTREIIILACRKLINVAKLAHGFRLTLQNNIQNCQEFLEADVVILCTGFESVIPTFLEPLFPYIRFDDQGRFNFDKFYAINWDYAKTNRIYALNFSRHQHGIIDPQTTLMAWRSGVVINDLTKTKIYETEVEKRNFVEYNRYG